MLYTFCTLSAILWLCYRLYKFLGIPVSKIVLTLKIRTPPATKVSIDGVSVDSITIHWENEPSRGGSSSSSAPPSSSSSSTWPSSSISHYLLYLNNSQVAVFPNSPNSLYTCCSIAGLEPETEYQLDFITVNWMGFMNKLPSVFCMTKSNNTRQAVKKSGQWRKNTLTTLSQADSSSSSTNLHVSESNQSTVQPAYASLTTLKDLESFSIDDLKKILICAQEDLHDVLLQQSSLLQDFQESKLQLELEQDNLKTHWSHEIDLRKSLKSTIKSLENSKLLYDLKLEKLKKNIDQSRSKIAKMEKDMHNWSLEESEQLNDEIFIKEFTRAMEEVESCRSDLIQRIKAVQEDISTQEEDNKRLNTLKKSSNSNANVENSNRTLAPPVEPAGTPVSLSTDGSSAMQDLVPLQTLLKKINEQTIEKTGQLTTTGEETLNKIHSNFKIVNLIRQEVMLDQELESKWKESRNKMVKRLETLESMFTGISLSNRQMRASLIVQPYAQKNSDSRGSNSNANSTVTLNERSPVITSPPMTHLALPNDVSTTAAPPPTSNHHHLALHNPSAYVSDDPHLTARAATVSPVTVAVNATASRNGPTFGQPPLVHGSLLSPQISGSQVYSDPALLMSAQSTGQPFPWGAESSQNEMHAYASSQRQQQVQHEQHEQQVHQVYQKVQQDQSQQFELDQPFEYDNANHLISGLRDMIYDETDYPNTISGYSNGFTTDQLDNYWTNQSTKQTAQKDTKPSAPSIISNGSESLRPTSPIMARSAFSDSTPLALSDSSILNVNNSLEAALMTHSDDPTGIVSDPSQSQNRFASPHFNFIWHSGNAPSAESSNDVSRTPDNRNVNGNSRGMASTWNRFNPKIQSPQMASNNKFEELR